MIVARLYTINYGDMKIRITGKRKMQDGGEIPGAPNAILEKKEKILGNFTQDGLPSLMGVNTGSHASGNDQALSLPDNSFVFSDTKALKIKDPEVLKLFGTTKASTPAQLATKYDLQKFTKVLSDPKSDSTDKKTAEMMVGNYTTQLNKLAETQESMKQKMGLTPPEQQPQMQQYGGIPKAQYGLPDPDGNLTWNGTGLTPKSDMDEQTVTAQRNYPKAGEYTGLSQIPVQPEALPPLTPVDVPALTPTNMNTPASPAKNFGSASFTAPTPDKMGIANSLLNLATIHRYPGYQAPINAQVPQTVFEDPTRAIAASQEAANSAGYNTAISGTGPRARANQLAIQGQAGTQAADIVAGVNNRNVQTANRANEQATGITNRLQEEQSNRLNKLYEQNVISAQQYDNAKREGRNDITVQEQNAWKDRSDYDFLNKTSPYFYKDPVTGARGFKSPEAEAKFNSGIARASQGTGVSESDSKRIAEGAKQYMADAAAAGVTITPEEAWKRSYQTHTERTRVSSDITNPLKGKISESYSEEKNQYGGATKHKFGGMTEHKLKKFMKSVSGM